MKHFASSKFWLLYPALPEDVRALADKNYQLLKNNPLVILHDTSRGSAIFGQSELATIIEH